MQKYIFPFIVFLIGFYLIGLRLVGIDFDGIPGDMGDARLNNYFLEQGYLYLSGQISSYWDAPFFYPEKATMSMSDNLFGTLPLYALFRALSFDRETAFQIWFLCLLILNFITCFICLKKLKISILAAAIGAYIFAFSLPVVGGFQHIQMFPKFAFPIIVYCLIRFIQDKKLKHLFLFLFFTVYQMYCGIYLGFMSAIASIVVFFVMIISLGFKKEMKSMVSFLKRNWMITSGIILFHGCMLFILLYPYVLRSDGVKRTYMDPANGLPTLASYFFPPSHTLLYNWLRPLEKLLTYPNEHMLFMGTIFIVAIFLSVYLLMVKKIKELKIWLLSFLILIFITLNISHYVSLYIIIYVLPGFKAIRAVSRIVQIELFFLAGLVAMLINYFINNSSSKIKKLVLVYSIFSLIVIDQFVFKDGLMSFSKLESQQRIADLKNELKAKNYSSYTAFAYLPSNHFEVYKLHIGAMLVSQELNMATINGYSASFPPGYENSFFHHPNRANLDFVIMNTNIKSKKILVITD